MRQARAEDARLLWRWSNDPLVLEMAFDPAPLVWEDFQAWLSARLADPQWLVTVLETPKGVAIGQLRFEPRPEGWEIDFSIAFEFRGQGYGAFLICEGLALARRRFPAEARIAARVLTHNARSLAACTRAGFVSTESGVETGRTYVRLERALGSA